MDEFELIRRFFDRGVNAPGVDVGIGDDGAVLSPTAGMQLVQVMDTLVAGVHFPDNTDPSDIAFRALAVNLSDIAAMGAEPRWFTLALTMSSNSSDWIESFAAGLFEAADSYAVTLVGGDTTRGPVVTVTVTVSAEIEPGAALLRSSAKVGDGIFVTGTPGDAAAGLALLQAGKANDYLSRRFLRPTPRIAIGRALVGKATAAIDVSDGLAADLRKLLSASGVGGEVNLDELPVSRQLSAGFAADTRLRYALTGGDDYELCFTANPAAVAGVDAISRIGTVVAGSGLVFRRAGNIVEVDDSGYRHFQ